MKLCLIGNSHAACMVPAWQQMSAQERHGADVRMFLLGGYEMERLEVQNDRLVVPTDELREEWRRSSGGLSEIIPQDYDAFVIVSLTFGFRNLFDLFSRYATMDTLSEGATCVSGACLDACIDNVLEKSLALKTRGLAGSVSKKPVILFSAPCQTERALHEKQQQFMPLRASGGLSRLYDRFLARSDALAKKHGLTIVHQPRSTMIEGGGYALDFYGRGAINSRMRPVEASDTSHMNAQFGQIAFEVILSAAEKAR